MDPDKKIGDEQRPYSPQKEEPAEQAEPGKFKRIMKVDETEESEKKKKRRFREDNDEDEIEDGPSKAPSSSSFSELMSDKESEGNIFDKESRGTRQKMAPDEGTPFTAPPKGSISTEGVKSEQDTPSSQTGQDFSAKPSTQSPTDEAAPQEPPSGQPPQKPPSGGYEQEGETWGGQPQAEELSENVPYDEGGIEETPSQQQGTTPSDQVEQEAPKKKEDDSSLLASQPKKSELDVFKKGIPKSAPPEEKIVPGTQTPQLKEGEQPQRLEEGLVPPEKEKKELPPTTEEGLTGASEGGKTQKEPSKQGISSKEAEGSLQEAPKESSLFQRFTPQQVRNQKIEKEGEGGASLEGLPIPTAAEGGKGEMGQGKKEEDTDFIEANSDTAGIPLPSFENPVPAVTPAAEAPAYSQLTPEVHELFEKMGGVMMIQQDKGVTTTTMNINMPDSVFNGAQIILEQYSTAPNAFNIQLVGNPESVKVFSENLEALDNSFKQGDFNFKTNLLAPILTSERKSPHLIRRKGTAGGKGGRGGKQGG